MIAAIDRAEAAAARWRDRPAMERASLIERTADRLAADRDRLAAAVVAGAGKPWRDADAEVCEAVDFCRYYARLAAARGEPRALGRIPGEDSRMVWEPRGVAGVIAPWNFPCAIAGGMAVAALVTGNPVVLKPAEQTPGIAALLVEHLHAAGIPADVVQLVCGPGETVGAALVDDPRVMTIAFTGSRAVGTMISERAARWLPGQGGIRRVASEMGGKNAIVVDTTADLDEAVAGIRASAFGYAGQKCSACSRLIVVDAVADALLERLVPACADLVVGDPRHPATDLGPVIDDEAGGRIRAMVARARADGLRFLLADDGPRPDLDGRPLIGPHIIADVPTAHPLATDEVFGPVLAVFRVPDFTTGIDLAMASPYRLTGGVYSRTPAHLAMARERFRVGNLYLNRGITGAIVGRHPFGGTGWSGTGAKAGGPDYLAWFSDARVITEHTLRRGMAAETIDG
jgi:RHH-type proline utilization regulon transcriptional repressor/proline dehydrogenase/delta 1-pyrroline-5-carboxylate dehydrogenase